MASPSRRRTDDRIADGFSDTFSIADVATAVTKGDLTRNITVQAEGEVAALKDNINEMIRNLRETTARSSER